MRTLYKFLHFGVLSLFVLATPSCTDLTELNVNPNSLQAEDVNPRFVLSQIISGSAMHNTYIGYGYGVDQAVTLEAMQYLQRDYLESEVTNTFLWFNQSFATGYATNLTNCAYLYERAPGQADEVFYKAVSMIMRSYWFGYMTSAWGDIPYTQAMKGEQGVLKPVYDDQKTVFKGILDELEQANDMLSTATVSSLAASSDPLFKGNALKWRQFANSLQLRFLMRLSEKTADMEAAGVNVKSRFAAIVSNATKYPIISTTANNAEIAFPGTMAADSWPGGTLYWTNRNAFYRRKPCATLVDYLKANRDPRLTRWIRPVDVQLKVTITGTTDGEIIKGADGKVKRYFKTFTAGMDTSMYVGLPAAHPTPSNYNYNTSAAVAKVKELDATIYFDAAANPHVSYLADIYQQNSNALIKSVFISAAEVNFVLAEAAARTWISGSALEYYKKGITESLAQYGIIDGANMVYNPLNHKTEAFSLASFMKAAETAYETATDKLEPILTQQWISSWLSTDYWFSWRRTGYPNLGKNLVSASKGQMIPVRYGYGDNEKNLNGENTAAAIQKLTPATDDQWSKMWLIQGTGKPW